MKKLSILFFLIANLSLLNCYSQTSVTTPTYSDDDWKPNLKYSDNKSIESKSSSPKSNQFKWYYGDSNSSSSNTKSSYNNNRTTNSKKYFGKYIIRYIVEKKNGKIQYQPIYNPLSISSDVIEVRNTNKGTKTWAIKYQGPIRLTNSGGSERFHNFYLTRHHAEFNISDRPIHYYQGKNYYIIIFDGQVQLAESSY